MTDFRTDAIELAFDRYLQALGRLDDKALYVEASSAEGQRAAISKRLRAQAKSEHHRIIVDGFYRSTVRVGEKDRPLCVLQRLRTDSRMSAAWGSLRRLNINPHQVVSLLAAIVAIKHLSDFKADMAQDAATHQKLNAYFSDCAKILAGEFDATLADADGNVQQCRRLFRWAATYFTDQAAQHPQIPTSQKHSAPVAFSTRLCADVERLFGTPLYEFVASVTRVVYETDRTAGAVRGAWERDQKRRRKPPTRTI